MTMGRWSMGSAVGRALASGLDDDLDRFVVGHQVLLFELEP